MISLVYDCQRILEASCSYSPRKTHWKDERRNLFSASVWCERSMLATDRYRLTMINDLKKTAKKRATTVKLVNDNSAVAHHKRMEISAGGTAQGLKYKEILFASSTTMDFFFYSRILLHHFHRRGCDQDSSDSYPTMWTMKLSLNLQPLVWLRVGPVCYNN